MDAALHWYHSTIRAGCARLVFHTVLAPKLGIVPNPAYAAEGRDILTLALGQLEGYWLQGGARPFMSGEVGGGGQRGRWPLDWKARAAQWLAFGQDAKRPHLNLPLIAFHVYLLTVLLIVLLCVLPHCTAALAAGFTGRSALLL